MTESLADWLVSLSPRELATVLGNRPDATRAPEPRHIADLAHRLSSAESVVAALRAVPLPAVQLAEAVTSLGSASSVESVIALTDSGASEHTAQVRRWLEFLTSFGLAWTVDGRIGMPPVLRSVFPNPLGLGPPLATVLDTATVDQMRRVLAALTGARSTGRRADLLAETLRLMSDPDQVRQILSAATLSIADELRIWAQPPSHETDALDAFDDDDEDGYGYEYGRTTVYGWWNPEAARRREEAAKWAEQHGLVYRESWSYGWILPAEIALALRGPDYRAPFDAVPPELTTTANDPATIASYGQAAVIRIAETSLALVDAIARKPVPTLKNGGIGSRELTKLAKTLAVAVPDARLALELCRSAGVFEVSTAGLGLSAHAATWRSQPPAARAVEMLVLWRDWRGAPTQAREDGKTRPALVDLPCAGCERGRRSTLAALAELPPGHAAPHREQLVQRLEWSMPFAHLLVEGDDAPLDTIFAEASTLGVVAADTLTQIGRLLIENDDEALVDVLAQTLPAPAESALFGADLTVVVTGTPAAAVSRVLDAAADRESRGGATVWRFSPASVRRAFDEGYDADVLEQKLSGIATGELPQALRYLVHDVGRRYGNLIVAPATSVIHGVDAALLAEVAVDRRLRKLGLRLVSPTVLASTAEAENVLTSLRAAGYLPVSETPPIAVAPEPQSSLRSGPRRTPTPTPTPVGFETLAERLLATSSEPVPLDSPTELALGQAGVRLSPDEVRILAHAIDEDGSVLIDYLSATGTPSRRVISSPELEGDMVVAWCHLRSDERWFRISRIDAVALTGQLELS